MNLEENKYEFDTLGYTILESVLDPGEVSLLRRKLIEGTERQNEKYASDRYKQDQWMLHNLMFEDRCFLAVLNTQKMIDMLDYSVGDTSIIYAYQSSSMPPNGTNYSNRVHVDCPRWIPNYTTNVGVLFALDDFNSETGGTYFLPGSHRSDKVPSEEYFYKKAEQVQCNAGDMLFFNARTFHSGGKNNSGEVRAAITINCCRSYMRQRFNFPEMADDETIRGLNAIQRRLLGFNVRMPKSLEDFYLPEGERLYLANQG